MAQLQKSLNLAKKLKKEHSNIGDEDVDNRRWI